MREPAPAWLVDHWRSRPYYTDPTMDWGPNYSRSYVSAHPPKEAFLRDQSFNNHSRNDGTHISPYDEGRVLVGLDGLTVKLIQGVDEESFKRVLSRTLRATTGIHPDEPDTEGDWEEMMRGGLQSALETQTIVFEVTGASRALTHQLVRSRRAGFHQQSQRATWYGDRPNVRWPESIVNPDSGRDEPSMRVFEAWQQAQLAAWEAYRIACENGVSYQDARFILPEGTTSYITCEYTVREFIAVFAYRGCSMFMWEMVGVMREMRRVLLAAHPFLEPYVKISCEKGKLCASCKGSGWIHMDGVAATLEEVRENARTPEHEARYNITECRRCGNTGGRKCTFQGWESVEGQCDFPWAQQDNRVFLPAPKYRIGKDGK